MFNFHIVEHVREETCNNSINGAAVIHKIEKKCVRAIGNINSNCGAPLAATETTSRAKISVTSISEGKSVLSALSMSLEHKDSFQYRTKKITPIVPAGQNTVVHLDNCTHFMAQRVTTTKTIRKAEICNENNSIVSCSTNEKYSNTGGIVDIDFKVILGGVGSSQNNKNKVLGMSEKKLQGRKKALPLEYKKSKKGNEMFDLKLHKADTSVLKKIKPNRRKKVIKPRQARKPRTKAKTILKEEKEEEKEKSQHPLSIPSANECKILRPCVYTLQNKKCLYEMSCRYLHSDFPCKYYYLNIPCPKGVQCQYMHNGPLEPNLREALQNHILDLLSTKPSAVESYFVQQIHFIDDISHRLRSFETYQGENAEIIEVIDDGEDVQVLVIDESSNDFNTHTNDDSATTNSLSNTLNDTDKNQTLQATINELDVVYENIKQTNHAIEEIDKKLKNLKTKSDMTPNEKLNELQNIYDQLKEQQNILKIYDNINNATVSDNSKNVSSSLSSSTELNEQYHIVNHIKISKNTESPDNLTVDKNLPITEQKSSSATISHVPQKVGNQFFIDEEQEHLISDESSINVAEHASSGPINSNDKKCLTHEEEDIVTLNDDESIISMTENECLQAPNANVPQKDGVIEATAIEKLPQLDVAANTEITSFPKEFETNNLNMLASSMNYKEDTNSYIQNESSLNSNVKENYNIIDINNEVETNTFGELLLECKQSQCDDPDTTSKGLEQNNSLNNDKNESHITEFDLTHDDVDVITTNDNEINKDVKGEECKSKNSSRIRLRSHTLQDNEENTNKIEFDKITATTKERSKPIRTRRLRLPKPTKKTTEKSNIDDCQINPDVINKLIKSTENPSNKATLEDAELPLTQNVILTNRFIKRAKAKHEMEAVNSNSYNDANVEQNISVLHGENNKHSDGIENTNVSLNMRTLDDYISLNPSQDPLIVDSDCDSMENNPPSSENFNQKQTDSNIFKLPLDIEEGEIIENPNVNCRNSFDNLPSSPGILSSTPIKEKFILGNPQVMVSRLKIPFMLQTAQKNIQVDRAISVKPIVTSSKSFSDNKSKQKRRSFETESDLDSSLKESKCLKISKSKSIRKVKIDNRKRTLSQQSSDSKNEDFNTDSDEERLTIETSSNINEQQESLESSSTYEHQKHQNIHQHKELKENESDLRQQISNLSNKSDLQLQTQQQQQEQQQFQQKSVERTSATTTKDCNKMPHKQYEDKSTEEQKNEKDLIHHKQYNIKLQRKITNTCNSYDDIEKDNDRRIYTPEKPASNSSSITSNEEEEINVEYSVYSSLLNKLTTHSSKCQINFEKSSVNITPISSPTYCDDTIASPSPIRKLIDFRMGEEIDGRLTNPPIPYILYEIDLGKIDINKPLFIDKLKKTIQLDPRVFKTHIKKDSLNLYKPVEAPSNALVPITSSNTFNSSQVSSSFAQSTTSMISPYDPRNRSHGTMTNITAQSLPNQTALTTYNSLQAATAPSPSSSFMHTDIPNAVPLALQYHSTSQPIIPPQQQQTPNMFLYGCLQVSPWYQSLMSTMKIQINQSISQLVRALNNFHRERVFNPGMVFDLFKIDCAGELLEIMRNLGIFVDANGIINEQRPVQSFGGRSCCNTMPVNATYSFIQQVLTPNTHCTSLTSSSSYNTAAATPACHHNASEPFVSCYIKMPEPEQKHLDDCATTHCSQHDGNNCNRHFNNRNDNSSNNNNQNNNRRYSNQFKKPYDNNNGNNNYQQRSNQRSSYNNNPRFMKPGASSPSRLNSSPPNSPRKSFDGGRGGSYGGTRGRGGGGRFNNNNRRFNNYNNNNSDNNNGSSSPSFGSNENDYMNKYKSNNSPSRDFSPKPTFQSVSPREEESKITSNPPKSTSNDEECWDSDN